MKNERRLIKRLRRGETAALREFYEATFSSLYRYVYFRAQEDHQETEDIVHDTFVEAIKSLSNFSQSKGTLLGWLHGIARNRLRSRYRRLGKQAEAIQSAGRSQPQCSHEHSLSQQETVASLRSRVNEALSLLPEKYARVLTGKYVERKSVRDIAQTDGQSEKAVESLLGRARSAFRRRFRALSFEEE